MESTVVKDGNGTGVPRLKGYPVVGALPGYLRRPVATMVNAAREGGGTVRLDLGPMKMVLLTDPDHIEHVLRDNAKNYVKGYGKFRLMFGDALALNEGGSWLRQRRLMQPAFHRRSLNGFGETMVGETTKMLDRWEGMSSSGQPVDVAHEMTLLTQSIIVKTMFGSEVGEEGEKISRAFDVILSGLEMRFLMPVWYGRLPLPANRRFEKARAVLDGAVYRIIGERRRDLARGVERDDLLGMLLSSRDEETGETMSDRQIRDEVFGIYLAGHETTAVALSWAWYLLSKNPEAARKVREEARRVLGDRTPGVEDLPSLVYTRMVIDETLRLYPPAWAFSRKAVEDDTFGEYRIPAGTTIGLSPYVTHHRPDLWENPEGFDPERFAPGNSGGRPRYAYFPFGGGPRQCIGNNFALMEATLIVATVARRYRLDLVPGQEIKPKSRGTLAPSSPVWMVPYAVAGSAVAR